MLASYLGKQILDGLLKNTTDKNMSFRVDGAYLGLLTQLPNNNETKHEDGTYFKEPQDPAYHRICISGLHPTEEEPYICAAQAGERIEVSEGSGVYALPACVKNQYSIMFPEALEDWGTIVGFGIFKEESGTALPMIWGEITDADNNPSIVVEQYEVPIIRDGRFEVSLV